ncbi:MAG: SAM-dependent methyltransferase [Saprospiraceae bacterium]
MLTKEEQQFIQDNLKTDTIKLVLNHHKYPNLDIKKLASQINIRKKAMSKLPSWSTNPAIFFPSTISWQQCSSEFTAIYKATILQQISNGNSIADLTGGFGVDAFYFAKQFAKVVYIEQQKELTEIVDYNNQVFEQSNIDVVNNDSLESLKSIEVDCIYLDPARRNERQQKVITLEDSTPNIIEIQDELLAKANYIMVKTSPMLDIHKALKSLKCVEAVHVVAVENECKELLFIMNSRVEATHNIGLTCVNISRKGEKQAYETTWNNTISIEYSNPKKYLYDANKSILKGNVVDTVGNSFGFEKIAPNTHLLTSNELRDDFQGRIFEIETIIKPSKKIIAKYLENGKANLIIRNFPESVANLRKKWKIKDGGKVYLFAVTLLNGQKMVVLCKRLIL